VLVGCGTSTIGTSAFEVMPSGPTLLSAPRQVEAEPAADIYINYISVRLRRELAKPEYPAEALAGGAGGYTRYVIMRIDEEGRVTDVGPSLMQPYLPHPFAEAFLAAVRSAVATWELEPARQVYWRRVPGGDDQYLRTEAIAERLEFRFSFTMADAP
jgi:outer membrane biosynthesis protein TonB